jgi:hypothetical protein
MARKAHTTDEPSKSIAQFMEAIRALPEDMPHGDLRVWYRTQKQHWLGWLGSYDGPGAYGRTQANRDAKFVYNHIVNPQMLLWLVDAAGVRSELVQAAQQAADPDAKLPRQAGAVRKCVPWTELVKALWPNRTTEIPTTDKASS